MLRARSRMRTGSPMSSTKMSPPSAMPVASITSCTASGIVMKKRVMSGCVTVTGPPRSICCWKMGSTEPELPSTLPKRTAANRVAERGAVRLARPARPGALEPPITVLGSTALSVEIRHEALHAVPLGEVGEHLGAERVVGDGLERVELHHRHVLVGRRVEDDLRALGLEHAAPSRRRPCSRRSRAREGRHVRARAAPCRSRRGCSRRGPPSPGAGRRSPPPGGRARARSTRRRRSPSRRGR